MVLFGKASWFRIQDASPFGSFSVKDGCVFMDGITIMCHLVFQLLRFLFLKLGFLLPSWLCLGDAGSMSEAPFDLLEMAFLLHVA